MIFLRIATSAGRVIIRNKLRSALMMLGVVIGIIALTLVVSAALGARQRVMERVKKFGLDSLMVTAVSGVQSGRQAPGQQITSLKIEDAKALLEEIEDITGVAPFNRRAQSEIIFMDRATTSTVFGVTPEWVPVWDWDVKSGEFLTEQDMEKFDRVAVIGESTRFELFKDSNPIGETIRIGNVPFIIKGVMAEKGISPGGGDMDNRVYIPLTTFMRRIANVDYIFGIKVRLNTARNMEKTAESISAILRERHRIPRDLPDDFSIRLPDEVKEMAEKVSGTFSMLLILVASIALLAGGVVVSSIMLISVNERRREIGLRKTLGARRSQILLQFLLESTMITLSGGVLGIIIGYFGARIISALTGLPAVISWQSFILGVLFSGLVGLLAGLQPARKAASLEPVESLRA